MVSVYDISFSRACKEAKISIKTAKKWLKNARKPNSETRVTHEKHEMNSIKLIMLETIEKFIKKEGGQLRMKDIQHQVKAVHSIFVSMATLRYWVKVNLCYSYKIGTTICPDTTLVIFV
jgi:hypothetical protein